MYGIAGTIVGAVVTFAVLGTGCKVNTPFVDVETDPLGDTEVESCVIDGRVLLPPEGQLRCVKPDAEAPARKPVLASAEPEPKPKKPRPAPLIDDEPAPMEDVFDDIGEDLADRFKRWAEEELDPDAFEEDLSEIERRLTLKDEIVLEEGGNNLAYCDDGKLHVGNGSRFHLSDPEVEERLCRDLRNARREARRVLGAHAWDDLDPVRRDVWIELCYWASCRDFKRARRFTINGNYERSAYEIWNSELRTIDPERTERMARWMDSGKRT